MDKAIRRLVLSKFMVILIDERVWHTYLLCCVLGIVLETPFRTKYALIYIQGYTCLYINLFHTDNLLISYPRLCMDKQESIGHNLLIHRLNLFKLLGKTVSTVWSNDRKWLVSPFLWLWLQILLFFLCRYDLVDWIKYF